MASRTRRWIELCLSLALTGGLLVVAAFYQPQVAPPPISQPARVPTDRYYFKYTERYLAEAAWRFNRRFDLKALVPRLLVTATACPPWAESALRSVPSYNRC